MKYIHFALLFITTPILFAQQVEGFVYDKETRQPLEYAFVQIKGKNTWTATNKKGHFNISTKEYPVTLVFHYMGKREIDRTIKAGSLFLKVYMEEDNLSLSEVQVTAKLKKKSTGSTIILSKQAIELVQAHSLADVLQLLPGKNIAEAQLHARQILTMRSAIFNNSARNNTGKGLQFSSDVFSINNAFGVRYLVDDIPINVNTEMSGNRGANVGLFNNITEFNSVGYGLDLRSIGVENIEEIEVIQGISSARYGDHNTGLIKIQEKLGQTPFRAKTTLRGGSYSMDLTKGVDLPKKWGRTNFVISYLHSNQDPRNTLTQFDRIRLSGTWQLLRKGKMRNRISVNYTKTIDSYRKLYTDLEEKTKSYKHWGIRISDTYKRYFEDTWIDNFVGTASFNYAISDTKKTQLINSGGRPVATSLEEGTFEVGFTPVNYHSVEQVNSVPFSLFLRMEANKRWVTDEVNYALSMGITSSIEDNFGKGSLVNPNQSLLYANPSLAGRGRNGWRNVNFNDVVPTEVNIGAYATTKIKTDIWGKKLMADVGFRYDNFNAISSYSPRANAKLIWNKNFKSRVGIGFFTKAPSLQSLYQPPTYYDHLIANYRNSYYAFALMHTIIRKHSTANVKPSKTWKIEAGTDFSNKWLNASLTGYYNKQYDGFINQTNYEMIQVPTYDFTFYPKKAPDYKVVGQKGVLMRNSIVTNGATAKNYGLELVGSIKKIESINTSLSFSMAYRYTKTVSDVLGAVISKDPHTEWLIGLHKPVPYSFKKLNSSITAIHHISNLGLVITLTAEQFIMATASSYGNIIYPFAYYDRQLVYHTIPTSEQADDKYASIRKSSTSSTGKSSYIPRMFGNYHLKIAKELKNGLRFSFYAVNFLNYLPYYEKLNSDNELQRTRFNSPISFGGTIVYKF